MAKTLQASIEAYCAKLGKTPVFHCVPGDGRVIMRDDMDGKGPYIDFWSKTLGPHPDDREADFDANRARKSVDTLKADAVAQPALEEIAAKK